MPKISSKAEAEFLWIPGQGCEYAAVKRMRKNFSCPRHPMGEAWFMGDERKMYPELMGDLNKLDIDFLQEMFRTIGSGTTSFGPMQEWSGWFHYLLGQLLLKAHEHHVCSLLEYMITAFMNIYPHGVESEPYSGFREDALKTLGKSIMDEECWDGQNIVNDKILKTWHGDEASGDFSSSMFFCLKYLSKDQIPAWADSILSIESPHWRAQLMIWLVGADKILRGEIKQPCQFKDYPSIGWEWSHCISGGVSHLERHKKSFPDFISPENRESFLETVSRTMTEDMYLDWLDLISQEKDMETGLLGIPWKFEKIYLTPA